MLSSPLSVAVNDACSNLYEDVVHT